MPTEWCLQIRIAVGREAERKRHLYNPEAWVWSLKVIDKKRQVGSNLGYSERYMTGIHIALWKKHLGVSREEMAEFMSSIPCSGSFSPKALEDKYQESV